MKEREISRFDLMYALNTYDSAKEREDNSTKLVALLPNGKTLKVWVHGGLPITSPVIIITVAWKD